MQIKKIALAVAFAAAAAASASAADIQIYGRVDSGLRYENMSGKDDSLSMTNNKSAPRIGFNIKEDLGNGYMVKVYLENGFKLDTGEFSSADTLFNRRAILAVKGPWGEIGAGRTGGVQSSAAPYGMGVSKFDVMGTSYSQSSVTTTFANSDRVNNGIHYVSPKINNLKFGLSYSTGDKAEEDDDGNGYKWQDKQHTFSAAVNYEVENLFLALTFANVDMAHDTTTGKANADARAYQVGGWCQMTPALRLRAGAGYQTDWATGAKLAVKNATGATAADKERGWDGYSGVIGVEYKSGAHKFAADVQHFNGELSNNSDVDFQRTIYAAVYEYSLAKGVTAYVGNSYSDASGSAAKGKKGDAARDTYQAYVGLAYVF